MDQTVQHKTRVAQVVAVVFGLVMLAGYVAGLFMDAPSYTFDLRPNGYAWVSAIGIVVSLVFLYISTKVKIRGTEAVWFTVFITTILIYCIAEIFMRLSATPDGAIFWNKLLVIGSFEATAGFLFVLNYLNPSNKHVRTTVFLVMASLLTLFVTASTDLIFNNNPAENNMYGWGWWNDIGPWYFMHSLYVLGVGGAAIFLLYSYKRKNRNPIMRRQMNLILAAFILPWVGAVVTEGLVPIATGVNMLSMHGIFATIAAGLMIWGLRRYKVFQISPAMLSNEILTMMSESVVVVNRETQIEFVNNESEKLFNSSTVTLNKQNISDIIVQESGDELSGKLASMEYGDTISLDNVVIKNGRPHKTYARLSISRVTEENGIDGYILVITDVTELKNSYDALEREKASVEHTVQVRTKELREAQTKLLETDKMKTEFVLLTSHNLRTPLSVIKGNIDLMEMDLAADERKRAAADLKGASKKLGDLVEDLLTISTIEAGDAIVRETIKIAPVFDLLIEEAKSMAEVNKNKFSSEIKVGDAQLKGNAHQLSTALKNLLDNAFKFTKEGKVALTAGIKDDKIMIAISDTGIGIPKDEIPKLFIKFHRATDALRYDYDGEGIGLYLTKLITEEHGGKIEVESTEGKGTTFTIILPTSKGESPEADKPAPDAVSEKPATAG